MPEVLLDAAGRPRSPATLPGFRAGRSPRNKGQRYPADPPTVAEIVAVMRHAGTGPYGSRLRALIVVLWRAGLRIHEALALGEADLDPRRAARAPRQGWPPPRGRHGRLGLGATAALAHRARRSSGRSAAVYRHRPYSRTRLLRGGCAYRVASRRRQRRRPPALRTPPAPPRARRRDGPRRVPLIVIQGQLGHTNLGITSIYMQGIDNTEIIDTVHARRPPMVRVDATLRL